MSPSLTKRFDATTFSTADLIEACCEGRQAAWAALVRRFSPLVWTIARSHRVSQADCEEIFQQTWLRAYQGLRALQSPERFPAWLTTCAKRESLKQRERALRYVPVGGPEVFDRPTAPDSGPENAVISNERRDEVLSALGRLSARDQTLLGMLSADEECSYDEVSRRLGVARGSVGPLRARALRRLTEQLAATSVETGTR
ncbi:RNA polymerase sigma factor [Streptomyces kronopolitis]|uniref:RNA polymerase sigma factor n=1 Tax=Streptomyces kronopolitis TaxID=1612435 RepID=A0ABQ2JXC4_9ACTN|nr:sigma-70 family RNA polymerase sigma factor [Streptomyces kronopolitis]GGN56397.1 RNA polymerase sigma factor [Streptomyces kronopolitis]